MYSKSNPVALASAIKETLENPYLSDKISTNCRRKALEFDINKVVKAHLSLYETLLK